MKEIRVFLSHEIEDEVIAEKLYNDLRKRGIRPFTSAKDILPGENEAQKLATLIPSCAFFIALLSKTSQSKNKGAIWKELNIALKSREEFAPDKIFIIPVRVDDCEIKSVWVAELKSADLFPSYKAGLKQVFRVLEFPDTEPNGSSENTFESECDDFVDRYQELKDACDKDAVPYLLFEAPPGYGKTQLLQAIRTEHDKNGWVCVYVKTPEHVASVLDLARQVAVQAGCPGIDSFLSDPEVIGLALAGFLKNKVSSINAPGAVLLIDSVEILAKNEIDLFINRFLIAIHQSFNLRVRLARRYSGSSWKKRTKIFNVQILTPLPFKYVKEIVRLSCEEQTETELLAAHLMHVTGGHPDSMATLLSNCMVFSDFLKSNDATYHDSIRKTVLDMARQIREAIPDTLRDTFDILCFFRRFNYRLLKKIVTAGLIEHNEGADGLERDLTATYLVKRKDGFLQDIVSRHLLHIRLFMEYPDRFLRICEAAGQIYEDDLKESANARADCIAIEGALNELQLAYYQCVREKGERTNLRERFFSEDGILRKYLKIILSRLDSPDVSANLISCLEDGHDQEFQFAVNFYLRGTMFDNGPYETMLKIVKEFFPQNTGANHA